MSTLSFVQPAHIGLKSRFAKGERWEAAKECLLRMAAFAFPEDKMDSLAKCCGHLGAALDPHDAGFVRLLALCMLQAQPAQLHSQLEYAARYVHPDRLWAAELGVP